MQKTFRTVSKRLRRHTVSLPIASSQQIVACRSLNIAAIKQRTAHWEPAINLKELNMKDQDGDGNNETKIFHMATFSAFDPGASHPLQLSSALPIAISSLTPGAHTAPTETQRTTAPSAVQVQIPSTISSLHHAIQVQQAVPAPSTPKSKPWPYSLPTALQPKAGTTYDLTYGDRYGSATVGKAKLGLFQKVVYGVPEPGVGSDEEA